MKHTCTVIAVAAALCWLPPAMARGTECQEQCVYAFIKCSGVCAASESKTCGAGCFGSRDACLRTCAAEKPKPVKDEKKPEAEKKSDAGKTVAPEPGDDNGDFNIDDEDLDDDADIDVEEDLEDDADSIEEPEEADDGPDGEEFPDFEVDEEDM